MKQPIQSNVVGTSKNNLIETFSKLTCSVGPFNDKIFGVSQKEVQISAAKRYHKLGFLGQVI